MCAWAVVSTAVTGDIVPAAWGNRVRDNEAYMKGQAGAVTIENALTVQGTLDVATGFGSVMRGRLTYTAGGGTAGYWLQHAAVNRFFMGLDDGSEDWWRIYGSGIGNILRVNNTNGAMDWVSTANDPDTGVPPTRLRRTARLGMLGAGGGTQVLAYNGDGTLNWITWPDGISAGQTVTFEYSGGLVVAIRLRSGTATGTILNSVTFTYTGGQVTGIAQS